MSIKTEKNDGVAIVTIETEKLNSLLAPELKSELVLLEKSGVKAIIIDLLQAKYCDSSGLSALLVGNRLMKDGGTMVISGLQPNVQKLIEISQLHNVLNIAESVDAARKML